MPTENGQAHDDPGPGTVRPATAQDLDDVAQLFKAVDDLHAELMPGFFRHARGLRRPETIEKILRAPDEGLLVADEDGRVVGLVHVMLYDTPPAAIMVQKRRVHVDNLVVADCARRRGYGRLLMEAAAAWARERDAAEVVLTVWSGNEVAERFYERLGYRPVNRVLGKSL